MLMPDSGELMFRTLIVEDHDTFRQTLRNLLIGRFPGMHIEEAKDGEETFSKIKDFQPDLIFMDIELPGESGLEVTQQIRASGHEIVIIILTSHDMPAYREASKQCGADHFVLKGSSSADDILSLVNTIVLDHASI
jgi:DNA-binding NarL/FixJ family response regulator